MRVRIVVKFSMVAKCSIEFQSVFDRFGLGLGLVFQAFDLFSIESHAHWISGWVWGSSCASDSVKSVNFEAGYPIQCGMTRLRRSIELVKYVM